MKKVDCVSIPPYFLVFREGFPEAAEEFVDEFNDNRDRIQKLEKALEISKLYFDRIGRSGYPVSLSGSLEFSCDMWRKRTIYKTELARESLAKIEEVLGK
jgi:hypothetical protein